MSQLSDIRSEIRNLSITIIKDLLKLNFHENKFKQNPIKAKTHRRYVEKNSEIENLVNDIKALAAEKNRS